MADAEGALPPSKKRVAGREISRDNPGLNDDDEPEVELGTFKRASEEVLAGRRIVKVRRQQAKPTSASNPFAGLQLVAPSKAPEDNAEQTEAADEAPLEEHDQENNLANKDAGNKSDSNVDDLEAPVQKNEDKADDIASKANGELEQGGSQEAAIQKENDKEVAVTEQESQKEESKVEKAELKNNPEKEAVAETNEEQNVDKESKEVEKEAFAETNEEQNVDKESKEVEKEADKEVNKKPEDLQKDTAEVSGSFSSFRQLSSRQNAFTGLAGTGFSSGSFSFGLASKEGSAFGPGSGPLLGQNGENLSHSSICFGNSSSGGSLQLFGSTASVTATGGGVSKPVMQEVPVETGEENEKAVFNADAILFEYLDGGWKERGKGELKLNAPASGSGKARLVMRARGNYRLILNANLFPDMSLKSMEKRGVTFACINSASEGKDGFATVALKFKEASILEEFRRAVETYKGKKDDAEIAPEGT